MIPLPPHIERLRQEEMRQQRARDPALWRPLLPRDQGAVGHLHGGFQPPLDVQHHPWAVGVLLHRPPQKPVVDGVNEAWDVAIEHPVIAPASLARLTDGLQRRLPRPVPLGIGVKDLLHRRLQVPLDHRLGDPIRYRRNAERPRSALALRDIDPPHRGREVTPRGQPIPALIAVVREVPLKLRDRLAIYASRALVGFDVLLRLPDFTLGNPERFCFLHQVPPLAG